MAKSRRSRKSQRKSRKSRGRKYRGGFVAPVNDTSMNAPKALNLAQGQQFAKFHENQHGGALSYGPYPGAVAEGSVLPSDLVASAKLLPLNQAFDEIRGMSDQAGGKRRKSKKSRKSKKATRKSRKSKKTRKSRKSRRTQRKRGGFLGSMMTSLTQKAKNQGAAMQQKAMNYAKQQGSMMQQQAMNYAKQQGSKMQQQAMNYAKQQGQSIGQSGMNFMRQKAANRGIALSRRNRQRGGLYRWGGGSRRHSGGSYAEMRFPMPVQDEGKMLIPASLQQQAGLNPEWRLAEDPMAFAPKM
jgi:hypothetical protein